MISHMSFAAIAIAGTVFFMSAAPVGAQIHLDIGVAPECPYGYYDTSPYGCAPYGYYGPEWFIDRVFIGAGPWFHGHDNFRGHVNNRYHPEHGYRGAAPQRGERAEPSRRLDKMQHCHGNETRDGRGNSGDHKR